MVDIWVIGRLEGLLEVYCRHRRNNVLYTSATGACLVNALSFTGLIGEKEIDEITIYLFDLSSVLK